MNNQVQILKNLKSKANSLERQLEACKWTNTEQYKELLDVEQQIEDLKIKMGEVYGLVRS